MSIQTLILLGVQISIFLTVLTLGMDTSATDLRYLFSKPSRLFRSLLAMNILGPITAIVVCKIFSLHPAMIVALTTLAIAPVSNMFPKTVLPLVSPGGVAYARGLFFASTLLSVVLTPLVVEVINVIFGGRDHVNPLVVAQVVVGTMLLPLGIGMVIAGWWPGVRTWISAIQKVSGLVLLVCGVVIIAAVWSLMGSLIREGTVSAIIIIALVGLLVGHVLGGPDEDERTVLAEAIVMRHPGVAIALGSLTDQPLAPVGVLLAVLVSTVALIPYTKWRKRLLLSSPSTLVRHS